MIGAGAVSSACLLSSVLRGVAREIVVVNRERKRARAVVTDLQYGAALSSAVQIRDGEYSDLTGAALVMITAGMNERAGGVTNRNDPAGRLKLLESNLGRTGVVQFLEHAMSEEERQALQRSAETLKAAVGRVQGR